MRLRITGGAGHASSASVHQRDRERPVGRSERSPSSRAGAQPAAAVPVDVSEEAATRNRTEVWWLLLLMVVGFFAAVAAHYVQGVYRGQPYPFNTFLYRPNDGPLGNSTFVGVHLFGDFNATWHHSGDASPYLRPSTAFASNYPPFAHLLVRPLSALPYGVALAIFLVGVTAAVLWLVAAQLRDVALPLRLLAAGVIGLLDYPMLFMLDRGNIEGLLLLLVAAAALCARRRAWTWSAVLIGAAAAMKGYPVLFIFVLLGARRYRDAIVAAVTAAGLTLISFMTLWGGIRTNARALLTSLQGFDAAGAGEAGVQHGSSLNGLVSVAAHVWPAMSWIPRLTIPLTIGVLLVGAVAVVSGRLLLRQSCAVVAGLTILVPSVAYDYRLVLMLVPLLVLLREPGGLLRRPSILALGLLFVPKGLPVLYGEVNIGAVLNPLLLLLLVLGLSAAAFRQRSTRAEPGDTGELLPRDGSTRPDASRHAKVAANRGAPSAAELAPQDEQAPRIEGTPDAVPFGGA